MAELEVVVALAALVVFACPSPLLKPVNVQMLGKYQRSLSHTHTHTIQPAS